MTNPILANLGIVAESVVARLFQEDKGILLIRMKGAADEQVVECESVEHAKALRAELFKTCENVSYAFVAKESEYKTFKKLL
jgi:hypothetical protein